MNPLPLDDALEFSTQIVQIEMTCFTFVRRAQFFKNIFSPVQLFRTSSTMDAFKDKYKNKGSFSIVT